MVCCLSPGEKNDSETLFLQHVHDEASMRLRSYDPQLPHRTVRGRSSKVQNNSMTVIFPADELKWPTELQPLGKKDGPTLTHALASIAAEAQVYGTAVKSATCVAGASGIIWPMSSGIQKTIP